MSLPWWVSKKVRLLRRIPLFSHLSNSNLHGLAKELKTVVLPAGRSIIREGEFADRLYIITDGSAEVLAKAASGSPTRLSTLGPGDFFGETGLQFGGRRHATVRSTTEIELLQLNLEQIEKVIGVPGTRNRVEYLKLIPGFDHLDGSVLNLLAKQLKEELIPAGNPVVVEGDPADRLFIVLAGELEVSVGQSPKQTMIATLTRGEIFGEMALVTPGRRRNATVTSITGSRLLSLSHTMLQDVIESDSSVSAEFYKHVDELMVARFFKQVAPFARLNDKQRRYLATRVRSRKVAPGTLVIRQGDRGKSCYLLRSGCAEVLVSENGSERVLSKLEAGATFGEIALLTNAARTASVRTVEDSELLELDKATLDELLDQGDEVAEELVRLMRGREAPQRAPNIIVTEQATAEGSEVTVLKNPDRLTYFRLSDRGRLIWDWIDGVRNSRDLTVEYFVRFGVFSPETVLNILAGLAHGGFIETHQIQHTFAQENAKKGGFSRTSGRLVAAMNWKAEIRGVDPLLTKLHQNGVRLLFTPAGKVIMALLSILGIVAFAIGTSSAASVLGKGHDGLALLFAIPGLFLAIAIHEAGHAFAVKAYGREVHRVGVGFYWGTPIAFVDTSDTWLSSRRERVMVSLAGSYATLVMGGLIGIAILAVSNTLVTTVLWILASWIYVSVVININPFFMEADGYYVLCDLLDRPNLREEILKTLPENISQALRHPSTIRENWFPLAYSLLGVIYCVGTAALTVVIYRAVFQGLVASWIGSTAAIGIGWALGALLVFSFIVEILLESRRVRARPKAKTA